MLETNINVLHFKLTIFYARASFTPPPIGGSRKIDETFAFRAPLTPYSAWPAIINNKHQHKRTDRPVGGLKGNPKQWLER